MVCRASGEVSDTANDYRKNFAGQEISTEISIVPVRLDRDEPWDSTVGVHNGASGYRSGSRAAIFFFEHVPDWQCRPLIISDVRARRAGSGHDAGRVDIEGRLFSDIPYRNFYFDSTSVSHHPQSGGYAWHHPSALTPVQSGAGIISGLLGDDQRSDNPDRSDRTKDCPDACYPIKAPGGPVLSRPEVLFGGIVLFVGFMYLSNKDLERRPFGLQHVGFWLVAVVSGFFAGLAAIPMLLRWAWPAL
jgi:hypothetical protein